MTKNHLKKRSTKEQPGCMGGIISLFDFNHHPSGRKLITEKAHVDGSQSSRISFDVANEYLETPKSRDARNEYALTHDTRRNPSTQKKASGIPMKALIAEEMTKEFESKRRTPGVVARLMGLEAMPAEALLGEHSQELDNDPQKIMSVKQQQQPKSNCDGRKSPQKSRASGSKPIQEISLSVSQLKTSNCPDQRAHSCIGDQSQEKRREELCKEFETLEDLKSQDCSNAQQLDEHNIQPVEKHMLVHEKLDEPDMALVHQKFVDAKNLVADEKLQQSKEFLDALEVLQSNRDLFLKFLQEPNSFFTKHLQDFQSTPQTPETMKTKMKSANTRKTAEELKTEEDISRGQYPTEGKKHDKQFQKQKGPRSLTGKEEELQVKSPSSGTKDRYKQYSIESAPVKSDACALPTRIVILKPGPGSASNARSPSSPSWSPRSEASFRSLGKGDRASNRDFLQEVRERLKLGLREYRKDDSKVPQDGDHGQIKDGPKDPREIAREIARHVRESVARNLTHKPTEMGEVSTSFNNFISKRNLLNRSRISSGETCVSSDTEVSTPITKHSLDHTKRSDVPMSQPANKWHSVESTVDREAKKRLSERLKMSHVDEDKQQSRDVNTLGKILALQEDKKPICRPKSPQNKKIRNVVEEGEQLYGQFRHEVGANCTYYRDEDENKDIIPPKSLGRSHSGPLSSTYLVKDNDDVQHRVSESPVGSRSGPLLSIAFDNNNEEIQFRVSDVMRDNAHEMISDNSSRNLSAERYKTKDNGSFFEGEASSLTGSFLMLGRKSSRKLDSSTEPDTNIHGPLEEACDPPKELQVESEKYKGNLEDLLVLENQECPKRSIDSPDMGNKEFKLSADLDSRTSPADTKGLGGTILEPLEWRPDSMLADPLQSGDQTDHATEVIPPGQPLSSPTFDSPTKQFPIQESIPSAINVEKPEQPSPVSVLDSPFQEETPSPKDFKKVNSDLQELRLRIRLLKFDGSEKQNLKADNLLQGDRIMSDDLDCREADTLSEKICNSASEPMTSSVSRLQFLMTENVDLEFSQLDDISCPMDKQSDLCYVRNVLVASGFTGDGIIPSWHVPNHPLDPSLFEKIENLLGHNSEGDKTDVQGSKWERRLLFDSINEVLAKILDPFSNHNPWLKDTKLSSHCKPAGKRLLRDTWAAIGSFLYTRSETADTLEKIIAKDMAKGGMWMELRNDVEAVGCQVEKAIFGDLIEEVIFDLVL